MCPGNDDAATNTRERTKFITPFVGAQVEICKELGPAIPEQCASIYMSKKKSANPKRGRPANPTTDTQNISYNLLKNSDRIMCYQTILNPNISLLQNNIYGCKDYNV